MTLGYKGISIFYEVQGKGKTLVLLHGLLENSTMWSELISAIGAEYQIVSIDLLGHGKTGSIGYVHSMEMMADAVAAVLEFLKVDQYHIIGHSMGGYVALALAKKSPESIIGLCLMNSTYQSDSLERKELRKRAIEMAKTNYKSLVRMSFINLFSKESRVNYDSEIQHALTEAMKTPIQGFIAAQEGMCKRTGNLKFFRELKARKLILNGKDDGLIDSGIIAEKLKLSDIVCKIISGGHMSHIENKSELTYNIINFIEN